MYVRTQIEIYRTFLHCVFSSCESSARSGVSQQQDVRDDVAGALVPYAAHLERVPAQAPSGLKVTGSNADTESVMR